MGSTRFTCYTKHGRGSGRAANRLEATTAYTDITDRLVNVAPVAFLSGKVKSAILSTVIRRWSGADPPSWSLGS